MAQLSNTVINGSLSVNGDVSGEGIINLIYPIGSIYISVNSTDPKILFGIGTWVKLPNNYTLWSCDSGAYDGTNGTIPAGLPNISGKLEYRNPSDNGALFGLLTGAFTIEERMSSTSWNNSLQMKSGSNNLSKLFFDANRGASVQGIYGNSSTVQPPAIKVYMWRRTA